jgi:tetratricopeptide (TPR) repeat protein
MTRLIPVTAALIALLATVAVAQTPDELFLQGQYAQAAAAYGRIPTLERTPAGLNRLGISHHLLGRFKEAEAAYQLSIRADGDLAVARNNLGALYYSQRLFNDADREFRRAAERDAISHTLTDNLHAARYARDNSRDARLVADQNLATMRLLLEPFGQDKQDESDMLKVVSLFPVASQEEAARRVLRADVFVARKLYEDAVIEYKRALAIDRYDAVVVNKLGVAYHSLRKLRDAEQQYREALRLRPNHLDALNNLAVIDYVRENYEGALERYKKALTLQPRSATLLRNMGACLFSLQRWEEGMQAYQLALAIDPTLFDPQPTGAGTAIQMNQQNSGMLNYYLAKVFALRGDKDRSLSYLLRAVEFGFDDAKMIQEEPVFRPYLPDERFVRVMETIAATKRS